MNLGILELQPPNLRHALDLSLMEWQSWCKERNFPSYIGKQIFDWIYQKGCLAPAEFSNISTTIREILEQVFRWSTFRVESLLTSQDGSQKFLLCTEDNLFVEMVLMPSENRTTLCISCQVGCKRGCTFCQTGKMGFRRDLSSGEILAQLHAANRHSPKRVTHVVFMGMGEPLDNYDEVVKAASIMIAPEGFALAKSHVTISTVGLVPAIKRLGSDLPVRLAISLHSADEQQRSAMMPINRKYSLQELKEALLEYPANKTREGITFEYVMIENVNDSLVHAKKLVRFLHGLKAKVNLIPVNHFPGMPMRASSAERLRVFQTYLSERSIPAPIRYSRGQDISGGCGQLAAKRADQIDLDPRAMRTHLTQKSPNGEKT
jgi:23S rRNA (adenine2503-C2)-methyltransferase